MGIQSKRLLSQAFLTSTWQPPQRRRIVFDAPMETSVHLCRPDG
jgi:hypothetical protein